MALGLEQRDIKDVMKSLRLLNCVTEAASPFR